MNNTDPNPHRYDDIIDPPHHVSSTHPQMGRIERAAQFSPFAALTGYGDAVKETARLTEAENELDEQRKEELNEKLLILQEHLSEHPFATVVYYRCAEEGFRFLFCRGHPRGRGCKRKRHGLEGPCRTITHQSFCAA